MATKVNNQVNESANEVMDARIVKLNEIIGIRLSSISSKEETSRKGSEGAGEVYLV